MDDTIYQLIGEIYDAVIEPARWPEVVDRIRLAFGFHIAMLAVMRLPSGRPIVNAAANVPQEYVDRVADYGSEVADLWGGPGSLSRLPLEEPLQNTKIVPASVIDSNRYVREWARPLGLVDQVGIALARDETMVATLGLGRHENGPPIDDARMDGLRLIAPHLRRAVIISGLLDTALGAAASFEATLSAITAGAILIDAHMHIIYANSSAGEMLQFSDPIRSVSGRLQLVSPLIRHGLEEAIELAATRPAAIGRRGMAIPAKRRDGSAVAIHVLPLARRSMLSRRPADAVAAVFVAEAGRPAGSVDILSAMYELTPAETRVYELMIDGLSTDQMARELLIAPSTLKTHTLRLFEKTGRHRRADLIRLASEIGQAP